MGFVSLPPPTLPASPPSSYLWTRVAANIFVWGDFVKLFFRIFAKISDFVFSRKKILFPFLRENVGFLIFVCLFFLNLKFCISRIFVRNSWTISQNAKLSWKYENDNFLCHPFQHLLGFEYRYSSGFQKSPICSGSKFVWRLGAS